MRLNNLGGEKMVNKMYIAHHGIKKQKWGFRRFQNLDGSLTPAGILRYRKSTKKKTESTKKKTESTKKKTENVKDMSDADLRSKVKRMEMERKYNNLTADKTPSKLVKTKKIVDLSSDMINQAKRSNDDYIRSTRKKEKLDLSSMTDQELRNKINRAMLEKQYSDIFANDTYDVSKGQIYASKFLDAAGTTLAIGSSALGIALAVKELKK